MIYLYQHCMAWIDEKTSEILLTNVGREATLFEMHENLELYKVTS